MAKRGRKKKASAESATINKSTLAARLGISSSAIGVISAMPDWPLPSRDFPLTPAQADTVTIWHRERRKTRRETGATASDARARKLAAEAELAELSLAVEKGRLVDRRKARRVIRRMFARCLAMLTAIPRLAAHRLPCDPEVVEATLDTLIGELRDTLADGRRYRVSAEAWRRIVDSGFDRGNIPTQ